MGFINLQLMKHPMNWLTILLMLFIAGIFGHYLLALFDQDPSVKTIGSTNLSTEQLAPSQQGNDLDLQ